MRSTCLKLLLPGAVLVLCGCTFARVRTNAEDFHEKIASIVPGETTGEELVTILGSEPNATIELWGGRTVYVYTFGDAKTMGLTLLLLNISKTNVGMDAAYFIIDGGVVSRMFVSSYSKDLPWDWWAFGG